MRPPAASTLPISPAINLLVCLSDPVGLAFNEGGPGYHQEAQWEREESPGSVLFITVICGDPTGSLRNDSCYTEGQGD